MHRVLSYQTAMRANNERDVREYVTKRTCVSLILSIAFFTLISGFLLGKFVADRQHHIKHIDEIDLESIKELQKTKETLSNTSKNITMHSNPETHSSLNVEIYNSYIQCVQEAKPDFAEPLDVFVENFVNTHILKQTECLDALNVLMEDLAEYSPP